MSADAQPYRLLPRRKIAGYGWLPDLPDARDLLLAPGRVTLPDEVDLSGSKHMPPVWDQGQLGSCTAHAIGAAWEFAAKAEGHRVVTPSRLFIYYHERLIEGTVDSDAGAMIRDGFKVLAKVGAPPESDWPYTISKFAEQPPAKAETDAVKHQATVYRRVPQTLTSMRQVLASGFPFAFGFTVYESFESNEVAKTGIMPMPASAEGVLGGHAVLACGYSMKTQRLRVRNSWSADWGQDGYFEMPFAYVLDHSLVNDLWVVTVTT